MYITTQTVFDNIRKYIQDHPEKWTLSHTENPGAIKQTPFDDLGLTPMEPIDIGFEICQFCDAQGALDKYGRPAYKNDHYGIRFDAVIKCPCCRGEGQRPEGMPYYVR